MRLLASALILTRTARRAGEAFGRLAARPARLLLGTARVQQKALALTTLLGISSVAFAATAPGSAITNTATAAYTIGANNLTSSGTVTVNTAACSTVGIAVDLMQYIPPAGAAQAPAAAAIKTVNPSAYSTSGLVAGPYAALPDPTLLGNAVPTALPANLLLSPLIDTATGRIFNYSRNEPIFVRVVSYDSNTNPAALDTVSVTLTTGSGDSEVLRLTETGIATGEFVGVMQSVFAAIGTAPTANDGQITVSTHNETVSTVYNHSSCTAAPDIATASSGLIDPYGLVFDSATGAPVDGASVSIVDSVTGVPATVYCDDGVTVLPQPVISGAPTVCDATMAAGGYHLPLVAAGSYKLVVTPPAGHTFPSSVPAASLPATVGAPPIVPSILGNPGLAPGASYGGVFALWGPPLRIDLPADSGGAVSVTIQKSAGKSVVGTGEFVPYTLMITNNSAGVPLAGAQVADHTPPGFRYQKGSARLNGATMADPAISADGRTLTFSLNIAAASTATVRYVLEVTPGARTGTAENTAAATGGLTSNTARASVVVREDLYRNKAMLIGRVIDGPCGGNADDKAKGMANARIVLQDGTYVLTDKDGKWHIDNLRAGTHVVQLDLDSLPRDYEAVACDTNSRFAGRTYSQFVNLRGGTLWRADFHVQKKAPETLRLTQTLSAKQGGGKTSLALNLASTAEVTGYSATLILPESAKYVAGSAKLNDVAIADPDTAGSALIFRSPARAAQWQDQYSIVIEGAKQNAEIKSLVRYTTPGRAAQNMPTAQIVLAGRSLNIAETFALITVESAETKATAIAKDDPARLLETLPYDAAWLSSAKPGIEWLHPQEDFYPALPTVKVAIKHAPGQRIEMTLNGYPVSAFHYDGATANNSRTVALSTWRGMDLRDGANQLVMRVLDASNKVVKEEQRTIRYTTNIDRVVLDTKQSRLIADGKTRPVIAVRFVDRDGYPVRRGINGEFLLNEPYRSWDRREGLERDPLAGRVGGKPRFEVQSDGLALIELEPTTQSGEAILNFQFNDKRTQEVRAWLEAGQRDWILVGFAEGTTGHKTLSGNMQALQAADTEKQLFDGNKLAFYAKGSIKGEFLLTAAYDTSKQTGNKQLRQAVDPTQYYTLYADASQSRFDAASASRLYVKLERRQFYAMFGDYDTGLTVTELSRYSRSLNGVKSEYKGEKAGYNAFATVTAQAYVKDEIPGNGTSGIYRLSRGNLVINSDKVRIETRDRFQSQVIVNTRTLARYLDYDIDYDKGTLTFREPISVRDGNLNPTYIVAEYESADPADKKASYGGRGSFKPTKQLEIGATGVHEGTLGATGNLRGMDVTYQPDDKTKVRAEVASTQRDVAGVSSSGSAWLGEVQHHEEKWDAKAYAREQGAGFGMGQQAGSETGTRKVGVDGRLKLSDTMQLKGQAYKQETLGTGAEHTTIEGRVDQRVGDNVNAYYGARTAQDKSAAGNTQSNQLIGGAAYTMPGKKLSLRGAAEVSDGTAGSVNAPDRVTLGADYQVTEQTKAFAEQEFARGEKFAANTTRVGLRTRPWSGGEVAASMGNSTSNDAERMYANLGMIQRWQINEQWLADFSLDRSQTLHNSAISLNINTPLPSVSATGDYTAAAVGASYRNALWSGNGRVEIRTGDTGQQKNLQIGMQRILDEGRTLAAGYTLRNASAAGTTNNSSDLRVSYAHRPNDSKWVWFDRADYITQFSQAAGLSTNARKLVNNLNANYMPTRHTQIALQYGAKYVLDSIDGADYKGYTDLIGMEIRHDITRDWDIGIFGSVMRSLNSGVRDYGLGASIGYNIMDNMWLSIGYNVRGLSDSDFTAAAYRARGAFITVRMKIDQDTLKLNDRKGGLFARKP